MARAGGGMVAASSPRARRSAAASKGFQRAWKNSPSSDMDGRKRSRAARLATKRSAAAQNRVVCAILVDHDSAYGFRLQASRKEMAFPASKTAVDRAQGCMISFCCGH